MSERTIWIAAGLLGLIVAVALAVLTSYVARPPAGLTSAPVSVGRQLAPARDPSPATPSARTRHADERATTPASAPPAAAEAPPAAAGAPPTADDDAVSGEASSPREAGSGSGSGPDDDSGRGRGRGRGRGGDD